MTQQANPRSNWIDENDIPGWGSAPDGGRVRIDGDARLPGLFEEWQADACTHEVTAIIQQNDTLGRPQYYRRCTVCGLNLSSAIAHAKVDAVSDLTAPDLDDLNKEYCRDRRMRLQRLADAAAERCQSGSHESYDDYLRSDTWRRRRAKILQRAGGVCEGCLSNPAEEVHHLTYEHLFEEFAWELRAVCAPCHCRLHQREHS